MILLFNNGGKRHRWLIPVIILMLLISCSPPSYRVHPNLEILFKNIKTAGLIQPDIKVYELSAGDVEELRDDWSATAKENVTKALIEGLKKKGITIKLINSSSQEIEDISSLFVAVNAAILNYTYDPYPLPDKARNFYYSVGPVDKLLSEHRVDALILLRGFDEISTSGRKALRAISVVTSVITGSAKRAGYTALNLALVDKGGNIIWFNNITDEGGFNLRDPESANECINKLISNFPEHIK